MPHKRNPVLSERLCGLARVLRGYLVAGLEDVALWHERDISHSSVERVVLPDALCLTVYVLRQATALADGLVLHRERALGESDRRHPWSRLLPVAPTRPHRSRTRARRRVPRGPGVRRASRATSGAPCARSSSADATSALDDATLDRVFDPTRLLAHQGRFLDALTWRSVTPRPRARLLGQGPRPLRVDDEHLLMVASDRLSAFDVVMDEPIPDKGRVLTALTHYWVREFDGDVADVARDLRPRRDRGLACPGSPNAPTCTGARCWCAARRCCPSSASCADASPARPTRSTRATGTVHHMPAPAGMELTDAFPSPDLHALDQGGDRATTSTSRSPRPPRSWAPSSLDRRAEMCVDLFSRAAAAMAGVGLMLADTKFELGFVDGELVVCDEVITPDSSRIWPADEVRSRRDAAVVRQAALPRLARDAAAGTARPRRRPCPTTSSP